MTYLPLALSPRYIVFTLSLLGIVVFAILTWLAPSDGVIALLVLCIALAALGVRDVLQTKHSILRNYPIVAHLRFLMEEIRPEFRQYFFEGEKDGAPFSRDKRSIVYQRAKLALDKRPFGTQYDVYSEGYEWMRHSMAPRPVSRKLFRVKIGGPDCKQPYAASVYNISAMSFGALSANAIRALNKGAAAGGFAHDTGEGGVSRYHREFNGDLIWEIGSGYFGCRDGAGAFSAERFAVTSKLDQVKMIEIKLSQGAKPGHGGVLPGAKVSAEIAEARGITEGVDCISPSTHSAFSTPRELIDFVAKLRELSGGKPIGFKLCVGHPWEFLGIVKAMIDTNVTPDFIVVDGKEGGTGAAPLEFADHMGMPLREGLNFVHNALLGAGLRDRISIGASAQIVTAFDMARVIALGADWCNSARAFMFAVGCIQSQSCHTDRCPTGVATQDAMRQRAIVVPDKADRVRNFHRATLMSLAELVAAAGLEHPLQFKLEHFSRRISAREVVSFAELYPPLEEGVLLTGTADPRFRDAWARAQAHSFAPAA
jgi:glutamate synthase domain-containing protein 2